MAAARPPPPKPVPQRFDPNNFIVDVITSRECAARAREARANSAEDGWETLRLCLTRYRFARDSFTNWALLFPDWRADFLSRKEAPMLLGRFIAQRGGDVEGDVRVLHTYELPYETLGDATKEGAAAKGKTLIVRGQLLDDAKAPKGGLQFVESTVRAVDTAKKREWESARLRTKVVATGEKAWARAANAEVIVEKGKEYVVLVRVDGVSSAETNSRLLLTILSAWTPAPVLSD